MVKSNKSNARVQKAVITAVQQSRLAPLTDAQLRGVIGGGGTIGEIHVGSTVTSSLDDASAASGGTNGEIHVGSTPP